MTLNMGEIVTVTKHDHEGKILEFVKTPIPLGTVEELKAAAFAENERKKDLALLRDTKALLASAKSINEKLAAKEATPLPPAPPSPAASPNLPAPAPPPPIPPPAVARQSPPRPAASNNVDEELWKACELEFMTIWAERDG